MFTQVKIAEATPVQMRLFATNFLQLDLTGSESDAEIMAAVQTAQPNVDFIFVQVDDPADAHDASIKVDAPDFEPQDVVVERGKGTLGRSDPRAKIMIPALDTPDGQLDVTVGVNGVVWQLKRGVDLDVPWRVVVALGLTTQDIITHKEDVSGRDTDTIITTSQRIPVQIMSRPSDDEIKAWEERTRDVFCP